MIHTRPVRMLLWGFLIIQTLVSCTSLPVSGNIPPGILIEQISSIPANSPFAPDPTGKQVALIHDGLALLNVSSGTSKLLSSDTSRAMAWSPDGRRLAAAFLSERDSQVRIYSTAGNLLGTNVITGRVNALTWRGENELLIAAMEVNSFSFGANFVQVLYRWEIGNAPVRIELQNSTLRKKMSQDLGSDFYRLFTFALSPYGDAIIYARLHDPPAFYPNLRYVLRNLSSGSEREIATVSPYAGGAIFAGDDDRMLFGDGETKTMLLDPWHDRNLAVFPYAGHYVSASGGGTTLLIDGHLLRSGQQLFSFPSDAIGSFNADGSLLFVRQGDRLLLVSGLPPDPSPTVPVNNRDLFLNLRQWRSDGLITTADFSKAREEMEKP